MALFKLLRGVHVYGSKKEGTQVIVKPDQVFEARSQNEVEFCRKYPDKFQEMNPKPVYAEKVDVPAPANSEPESITIEELRAMNVAALLKFAREQSIDVKGLTRKEELLKVIESALSQE